MLQFLFTAAAAYGYAIAIAPLLKLPKRAGHFAAVCAAVAIVCFPLLIAADQMVLRGIAEFICVDLGFKMIDFARQCRFRDCGSPLSGTYLRFLIPFPVLLVVFGRREKRLPTAPPLAREIAIIVLTGGVIVGGFGAVDLAATIPALRSSFLLDHVVKVSIFAVTIYSIAQFTWALERLARYDTRPVIDRAYLATTPGEFWRLYNNRVGEWLYLNVFRPSGGRRAPVRGIFAAFFVSAAFHEVCFGIATSRFTGYQFTFFMLQAPAVAVSQRLQPTIDRAGPLVRGVARGLTVIWFYTTAVFFLEGVNRIFPFLYASRPWLP